MDKKNRIIDIVFFASLFLLGAIFTFILFYNQVFADVEGAYHSDMLAYILEMQGLDSGYSFPYPIYFKLGALVHIFAGPEISMAIALLILNSLGMIFLKLELNHLLLEKLEAGLEKHKWLAGVLISFCSIGVFFVSMLFGPNGIFYIPTIRFNFVGVFSGNPFHNATYMAARPFAILAFFKFGELLAVYEKWDRKRLKDYILFSLYLLLATMTKPSFTIVLAGAAGLIMLAKMLVSKFKNFIPTVILGLTFVPTFIDLLYQYNGVFVPGEGAEGGMGLCFGDVWLQYCTNIPLAILLAIGFPLLVLICNFKKIKESVLYRFSWDIYIMSFLMAFCLYEKGFRKPDFNFSWGYMYGIFFAFVGAIVVLLEETFRGKRPILIVLQWLAFGAHLVCGLFYFWGIYCGGTYY